jgi:branched-chain amino acid transport system substrate-binding protein
MGVLGTVLIAGPPLVAACGDDRGPRAGAGSGTSSASADIGNQLAALLHIDPSTAGRQLTFKVAAVLALSGTGSFYGRTMSRGIDLAVEHIRAGGGPTFSVTYYDHKSGDAAAGHQAVTELGEAGYPAKLASYADDLGTMLAGTAQYKIFTLDGGGGAPIYAQGQPYFWGTRAITPDDVLPGLFKWLAATRVDKKTVGLAGWDVGEPNNSNLKTNILRKIAQAGYAHNGLWELFPIGTQDFSAVLPRLKANEPDILLFAGWGQDPGSFLNQSQTAGLRAVIIGFEFTPDGLNASKGAYDKLGWTFAYDYFDADRPVSPLAKLFVAEFKKKFGDAPDFYAANYYEDTLNLWELIRRIIKGGGSVADGPALDAALQSNLTLTSVYGGDADTVGTYALDPSTHSVLRRPMGVFEYRNGKVTPKAFFDIGGDDYRAA